MFLSQPDREGTDSQDHHHWRVLRIARLTIQRRPFNCWLRPRVKIAKSSRFYETFSIVLSSSHTRGFLKRFKIIVRTSSQRSTRLLQDFFNYPRRNRRNNRSSQRVSSKKRRGTSQDKERSDQDENGPCKDICITARGPTIKRLPQAVYLLCISGTANLSTAILQEQVPPGYSIKPLTITAYFLRPTHTPSRSY